MTVFTGAQFAGTTRSFGQWTYYTGASITNISSFKLKRGYQAVLARSANGANNSKCYIAQDGDLEIGVLPATLDKQVQFIYVTPWRWTSKKGIAGNPGINWLNVNWWYDWNLDQSSSRDLEYAAIRQQPFWPGLSQNWQSLGINTVLGYNEPDNSSQDAYKNLTPPGSVSDAVSRLPDQLATGLRVGSPATTDGGRSGWLYPFVSQADGLGYRVDYIAIHYYWGWNATDPAGAASQMYNFLLDIWNNTHRPIWITEWNNGANWTDNAPYAPPTYAQQQACIAAMTQMLETTPFVERYSLYNWVEDTRSLVTSSNTVTPAGTTYSNLVSAIGYSQTLPDNGTRGIAQFLFNTNTYDTSGYYNNALAIGALAYTAGHNAQVQAIALDGTNNYIQLPANIAKGNAFTFAGWIYWNGGAAWQRIFDFGSDTTHYLFLTPNSGSGTLRFAINNGSGEQTVEHAGALAAGSWQHVAVTLSNNIAIIYVNGVQAASSSAFSIAPSAFAPFRNYLGKSQFADPLFSGNLDEVEIADYAMSASQISTLYNAALYPTYASSTWTNDVSDNWSATANWNNGSIANGISRVADFSTINLTADRTVTVDTARTIGGLRFGDASGQQNWTVAGPNTLTLNGGGANAPLISVNQNTATISAPLANPAASGFTKSGNGTLTLNATNNLGGGLTVAAGAVNIAGASSTFGSGTSSIGYLTGSGKLNLAAGGSLSTSGEFRVGGSDKNGLAYNATGVVTVANATLAVGSFTVARGNYLDNSMFGKIVLNSGGTLISTNDAIIEFAGKGLGKLVLNGGNFIVGPLATKWLMVGYYDTGAGELDITNGNLSLENGSSLKMCRSGNTGSNIVNQIGGAVTFYSDAGTTIGGAGNLDLNYAGGASSSSTYNLNGGTLTVPQIIASSASGSGTLNFNGGTLKAATNTVTFMQGLTAANVRNNGLIIDTAGFNVTIGQPLQHSSISGDIAIDGGLRKNGAGTLSLNGTNSYKGDTTINAGTLKLGNANAITNSRNISLSTGAVLDFSTVSGGFTLGTGHTLSGSGIINGTLSDNGTIAPGTSSGIIGSLTFNNSLTLNGSGSILMKIDRNSGAFTNDQIILPSTSMNCGGTLTIANVGADLLPGDSFQLFSATAYNGFFLTTNLPPLNNGLVWSNSLASNGSITVISTTSLVPTNIVWAADGTNLTLSWPSDHTGWRLQVQTNTLDGTNWIDVPESGMTNNAILPVDPTAGSLYYRLVYP